MELVLMTRKLNKDQRTVIREIRRLDRAGEALNISAVKRNHPQVIEAAFAVKPFWGWKQALEASGLRYEDIKKELQDNVECLLCGIRLENLGTHLRWIHERTGGEYLDEFPNAELTCETFRTRLFSRRSAGGQVKLVMPHWEPIWSREYLLDRVHALYLQGVSIHLSGIREREPSLRDVARRLLGSWDEVLRAIGFEPLRVRASVPLHWWTKGGVRTELQRLQDVGYSFKRSDLIAEHYALYVAMMRVCGGFPEALTDAGIVPRAIGGERSERDRLRILKDMRTMASLDRAARRKAVVGDLQRLYRAKQPLDLTSVARANVPLVLWAKELFGTWAAALRQAGLNPARCRGWSPPDYQNATDVIREIQKRKRLKYGINVAAVQKGKHADNALYYVACKYLSSWDAALQAAGLAPETIRKWKPSPYASRSDVRKAIRGRRHRKLPLNPGRVQTDDQPLYKAALRLFGSWRSAIGAAGFDYTETATPCRRRKYPNKESVLVEIRRRKRRRQPLNFRNIHGGPEADRTLYKCAGEDFGSWRSAITAAGLSIERIALRSSGRKYPCPDAIVAAIRGRHSRSMSLKPSLLNQGPHPDAMLYRWAKRYYGSWKSAIVAAGLDFEKDVGARKSKRKYPAKQAVRQAILDRKRKGLPLNAAGLNVGRGPDPSLYSRACEYYGSWSTAIKAAGLDYDKIALRKRRTKRR